MDVDLQLFKNIMAEARHNTDLLDSYSPNQFKSKELLVNHINKLDILNKDSEVIIFGSWYGSILVPAFEYVKRITLVDCDKDVLNISKNRLFNHKKNIDYVVDDVFAWASDSSRIKKTDLIINTSCEHMTSMKELELNTNSYFAFQSNNMFNIPTHINCVKDIEQFENQMPFNSRIIKRDMVKDDRGTRFTIIGRYNKFSEGLMR